MILRRRAAPRALISLVPMIDVMLILLVFFMVTSTYLNLDMVPALQPAESGTTETDHPTRRLMIRIGSDGIPNLRGNPLSPQALDLVLREALDQDAATQITLLPSGAATTQALLSVMDQAALAGALNLRVLQLEATQ
ncbi:biopolymer transporter ExbD [Pseudophaeobacter sp.]|uniref:ExbD/TolR family protein n=1 Tax=Pseudophaeobacter sp. TaxID=1971739 RepID=UPI003299DDBD